MEIIWEKVRFERTKGDITGNQTFALEVSIAKDENYLAAFDFVKATVNNQLGIDCEDLDDKRKQLKNEVSRLEYKKNQIEEELKNAKTFYKKAEAFFEKLGLNPVDIFGASNPIDDIPF